MLTATEGALKKSMALLGQQPGFIMLYYVIWGNGAELKIDGKHITIYIYTYDYIYIYTV